MGMRSIYPAAQRRRGFGLAELLVVVAIIAVLIALLLPAIQAARFQAKTIVCASNMRQITMALISYASDNRGFFPPSFENYHPMRPWYHVDRVGRYLKGGQVVQPWRELRGSVLVCPMEPNAARTYAISWYASSLPAQYIQIPPLERARNWNVTVRNPSRMMLLFEGWLRGTPPDNLAPCPTIGGMAPPGRAFGAGGGIKEEYALPVFVYLNGKGVHVNCELPYYRHRLPSVRAPITTPLGRVNIGYADGHVALKSNDELADFSTGLSRLDSWWTPKDDQIDH